ncbi:SLC13 family permease [Pararoseomonas indoligenes]|uniref:Anion permease n=1 Tax=Roseomonas indoligenes TaxID=2820811 RepID=A0A940N3J5_9PROT|nr:SLC13 family permease [Pararoseomonas indoligenes]MBP0495361.1 anion permease [Pararoseomonas indoligenes]
MFGVAGPVLAVWLIAGLATAGVILRPFRWPEAAWAVAGAAALVLTGLLSPAAAWHGVLRGRDVYLFLLGMMLLAEVARREGLFDWLAVFAVRAAGGSGARLLAVVYGVGVVTTAFLSNDATAVVLTPAVLAAARAARADPMPHLYACAFVANAASFVLPISNPANLVVFGEHMPSLGDWLLRFTLPSVLAIGATFLMLRLTQRRTLAQPIAPSVPQVRLPRGGAVAGLGIVAAVGVLLGASAVGADLGWPTFLAGAATALVVALVTRQGPGAVLAGLSWGVLPLVAGLFILVQALEGTGAVRALVGLVQGGGGGTALAAGALVAFGTNVTNNLPAGLVAGAVVQGAGGGGLLPAAVLIGVDLGPNLSVTGSLATILWMAAIRREGLSIGDGPFLRLGVLVMPPALLLALGVLALQP